MQVLVEAPEQREQEPAAAFGIALALEQGPA